MQKYVKPTVDFVAIDNTDIIVTSGCGENSHGHGHGNAWGYNNGNHNGHGNGHNPHDNP